MAYLHFKLLPNPYVTSVSVFVLIVTTRRIMLIAETLKDCH